MIAMERDSPLMSRGLKDVLKSDHLDEVLGRVGRRQKTNLFNR
jgi:hypothetical protein